MVSPKRVNRDDFSEEVKKAVAARVGHRCSRPSCRAATSGPQLTPSKFVNIGVAAHITAAAPGGPRYDPALTPGERKDSDNAIWLCQNCGKLVDNDASRFTVGELRRWRREAEEEALSEVGKPGSPPPEPTAIKPRKRANKRVRELQERCHQTVRHLPPEHKQIISRLEDGLVEFSSASGVISSLEKGHFIERVMETDKFKALYRLHPDVEAPIKEFLAEDRRSRISTYLTGANEDEIQFLRLFSTPAPAEPDAPHHPRLRHGVYMAGKRLVTKGILIEEGDAKHKEKVRLAPDAITIIEDQVLKGGVKRTSITLDLGNIDASGRGGSGAPQNTYRRR